MSIGKKILVFGATGEIGSRVARGCVEMGHEVTGASRGINKRHRIDLHGVELIYGDKKDKEFLKTLSAKNFNVVIDTVPGIEDVESAHKYFNGRIEHYFMCSSTGTFVPLRYLPADEDHPWREKTAVNFYRQCERDMFALKLHKEDGFPVTIFRPTNIIGAGRVPLELWGGRDISYFQLLKEGKPVEVPGDGTTLVQSGCNDDLAAAFVKGAGKGKEINGEIFIISCRKAITLNRYLQTAREVLKSSSPVEYLSIREILARRPEVSPGGLNFLAEHMCFDI
ncbi:MAG: NAD-dependent epimerase/dehydratase family protein, partial [Verrucomicrobia bacterium]|nr:NAD-dependent epimerase/dehydratase family protein [Verrucomicrobiota bacterium]